MWKTLNGENNENNNKGNCKFTKLQEKFIHLICIDDIKLFEKKNDKELETLIQTIRLYSQDIEMKFGVGKCVILVMKSRKTEIPEGTELPDQQSLRMLGEKEIYNHLRIMEADIFKLAEMKKK